MRDYGLNKGEVQQFETSNKYSKGVFYGFRKMFWSYLKKLNVPFFDACCEDAGDAGMYPVRYNSTLQRLEFFNGVAWADISGITETTTTSTTTTTTAP